MDTRALGETKTLQGPLPTRASDRRGRRAPPMDG
jgi:hypothetical protein